LTVDRGGDRGSNLETVVTCRRWQYVAWLQFGRCARSDRRGAGVGDLESASVAASATRRLRSKP